MAEISNKTLDEIRASYTHYECKWLFPVRMENNSKIEWVAHIYAALGKFKKPITQTMWETCLRTGRIAAYTPEEQDLLWKWWTEGWKETPQVAEHSASSPCPILQMAAGALGETLELIYPTIGEFVSTFALTRHEREKLLHDIEVPRMAGKTFRSAYPTSEHKLVRKEPYRWILFDPNNKPLKTFSTKAEMAAYLECGKKPIDVAIASTDHAFYTGFWIWKVDWGFIPISPKGVELPHWEKDLPQEQ